MVNKEINLIPGGMNISSEKIYKLLIFLLVGLIILSILLFLFISPKLQISRLQKENTRLTEEIASAGTINEKLTEYENKQEELKNKTKLVDIIDGENIGLSSILEDLSAYLPQNVFISQMSVNNGQSLDISFVTESPVDTARLIVKLQEMDKFEEVEVKSVPVDNKENVVKFNLKLKNKNTPTNSNTRSSK